MGEDEDADEEEEDFKCLTLLDHCWEHLWSTFGSLVEHFWTTVGPRLEHLSYAFLLCVQLQ
eukprot:15812485-Heterocapsa_arctica.AAC.1